MTCVVEYKIGDSDDRPWGRWRVTDVGDGYAVKTITVNPGAKLSLQRHHHRSETWMVATGAIRATVNDQIIELRAGQSIEIPLGAIHRMENSGCTNAVIVEVQRGTRLCENDIVRIEDVYGRAGNETLGT